MSDIPQKVENIFFALLIFLPLSWAIKILGLPPILLFVTATLSMIPLARIISDSTATIATHSGSTVGAFINAAFANVTEIFIALFALRAGLIEVIKATIIGSLLSNLLLLLGASLFIGGLRYKEQRFNTESVGIASTMLIISFAGFAIPSLFSLGVASEGAIITLSGLVSVVLIVAYLLGIVFTFFTHRHLFEPMRIYSEQKLTKNWGKGKVFTMLAIATGLAALQAELLVQSINPAIEFLGFSPVFVGIAILGVIGNIGEMTSAITAAARNNVNLTINIAIGSTTQVAMFVVPILVFASIALGTPLTLVFSIFQIIAVLFAVLIVNYLSGDGRCNWLEGAQLLSVYFIIIVTFFFVR